MSINPASLTRTSTYHSFLLRLWQEEPDAPWRASLQNVQTGTVVRFTHLNALIAFLQEQALCPSPAIVAPADDSLPSSTSLAT